MAAATIIEIASEGDVVLICSKRPNGGLIPKLQVESAIMACGSPVFKTMLRSPNFAEGAALAANSKVEIPLPEDDVDPMIIICNIFHLRHNKLPESLHTGQILAFAQLCDKYSCLTAVSSHVERWLVRDLDRTDYRGRLTLLDAAKLLRHKGAMQRVRAAIVLRAHPTTTSPEECKAAIETVKTDISAFFETELNATISMRKTSRCTRLCSTSALRIGTVIEQLAQMKLWPMAQCSKTISDICLTLATMNLVEPAASTQCGAGCWMTTPASDMQLVIHRFREKGRTVRKVVASMSFS